MWTAQQIAEAIMVEQYTTILPFKLKNWVLCHQPSTLKEAIILMEAYILAETGHYLILKAWRVKAEPTCWGLGNCLWGKNKEGGPVKIEPPPSQ